MEKGELVKQVARRAKQKDGGRTSCSDRIWGQQASNLLDFALEMIKPEKVDVEKTAEHVLKNVRNIFQTSESHEGLLPEITPVSASALDKTDNASQKRKYQKEVLNPDNINYGAFVSVKAYTQFCMNMTEDYTLREAAQTIMTQDINKLFPRERTKSSGSPSEKPRSLQLTRLLQIEFAEFLQSGVTCNHQAPVAPEFKPNEQDVDVSFITLQAMAVCIEYKPTLVYHAFRTQAGVYGTDTMNTSRRPCITVQIRGTSLEHLEIRAYGVVKNYYGSGSGKPSHALTLLLDGHGAGGLKMLISGLKAYLKEYENVQPNQWHCTYLSNVVSLHSDEASIFKAYDYRREREVPDQDRRAPNITLVRKFIDAEASIKSFGANFHIVKTKFLKREDGKAWYGAIQACFLARIVEQLMQLHQLGIVHGDVRLRNMILHAGVVTDYDFSRVRGSLYPSTLRNIEGDGNRHPDVSKAIEQQNFFDEECRGNEEEFRRHESKGPRVEQLKMEFDHDIYSLKYVLRKFIPLDNSQREAWTNIIESEPTDLTELIRSIEGFHGEVKFGGDMGTRKTPSVGTGSPVGI